MRSVHGAIAEQYTRRRRSHLCTHLAADNAADELVARARASSSKSDKIASSLVLSPSLARFLPLRRLRRSLYLSAVRALGGLSVCSIYRD